MCKKAYRKNTKITRSDSSPKLKTSEFSRLQLYKTRSSESATDVLPKDGLRKIPEENHVFTLDLADNKIESRLTLLQQEFTPKTKKDLSHSRCCPNIYYSCTSEKGYLLRRNLWLWNQIQKRAVRVKKRTLHRCNLCRPLRKRTSQASLHAL